MSGLIWIQSVDTQIVFLEAFFEKVDFEKNQQTTKKHKHFLWGKELKIHVQLTSGVRIQLPHFAYVSKEGCGETAVQI